MGKLCARGKAAAKRKFRVYPSAYANAYAVKVCKGDVKGPDGKKRTASGYSKSKKKDYEEKTWQDIVVLNVGLRKIGLM